MFWNTNSSTKFASFPFDRYRTEISPINYLQKEYTYALIEISPMSKLGWLLRSSWKHELKLSHNSSNMKGDALRTNVKIIKWNESFSRQRLSQSCLFKSLKIKTKKKRKENRTQQNYKFLSLKISINSFNVITFDISLKEDKTESFKPLLGNHTGYTCSHFQNNTLHSGTYNTYMNSEPSENFEVLKKCPRKLDYLIFEILLIKKEKTRH